jgi:hypothetical protein
MGSGGNLSRLKSSRDVNRQCNGGRRRKAISLRRSLSVSSRSVHAPPNEDESADTCYDEAEKRRRSAYAAHNTSKILNLSHKEKANGLDKKNIQCTVQ